ncbi:MAG: NAD(P)-dependent oxidoreductase [Betaproteobacteria bacterium]
MNCQSILLVGANGFVGSHAARALVAAGHRVTGFGLPMSVDLMPDLAGQVKMVTGSVEVIPEIEAAFDAAAPDVVIWSAGHNANAAGLAATGEADPARALAVNTVGLFNVLDAARRRGVRRALVTGSLVAFGPASMYRESRIDETAESHPTTGYGLSKAMGEQVARYFIDRHGMEVVTFRLSVVFGPGRWYGGVIAALNALLASAAPGRRDSIQVPAEPFDLVHVKDVATALRLAVDARQPLEPLYHLNSFTTTYAELVRAIERQVPGYEVACTTAPAPIVFPLMNFDRIRRDLGYVPAFDVDRAIADCLAAR